MKIIVAGGCGFVGSNLSVYLHKKGYKIFSVDNLQRKGSILNEKRLKKIGIKNFKKNISLKSSLKNLPKANIIIDCCAEPSVEASKKNFEKVFNSNLLSTKNLLIKCIKDKAKFIFISSSRVYSINHLRNLKKIKQLKFRKEINLEFSTSSPKTLYGFTKLASEDLIKEFSYIFNLKYIINRFGVISGPWQFGKVDQGFLSLFMWNFLNNKIIKFIGYNGSGLQERDILHVDDFCELIFLQIKRFNKIFNKSFTAGGSTKNKANLKKIYQICNSITNSKPKIIKIKKTSQYDIPYFNTSNKEIKKIYKWKVKKNIYDILNDIFKWQKNNISNLKKFFK
jgi:CDP-paratose 2-epimerase